MEETLKRTEDLSNSVEEDHQDEDSCTRRRVRGTGSFVLCFNIFPSENTAKLRNKKEQEEYPSEMPNTQATGSRYCLIRW